MQGNSSPVDWPEDPDVILGFCGTVISKFQTWEWNLDFRISPVSGGVFSGGGFTGLEAS